VEIASTCITFGILRGDVEAVVDHVDRDRLTLDLILPSPFPSSLMHRALCIPEVVMAVVQNFAMHKYDRELEDKRVLYALARTCRAFSEPALDCLWAVPDLCDLALLMSEDIWKIYVVNVSEAAASIRRLVSARHICVYGRSSDSCTQDFSVPREFVTKIRLGDQFLRRARHVRRLRVGHETITGEDCVVSMSVLEAWCSGTDVFSKYQSLHLHIEADWTSVGAYPIVSTPLVEYLCSTPLTTLDLNIAVTALDPAMSKVITSACAALERLRIYINVDFVEDFHSGRWTDLQTVMLLHTTRLCRFESSHSSHVTDITYLTQSASIAEIYLVSIPNDLTGISSPLPIGSFARLRVLQIE
jgi:hypothetical protein